MRKFFRLITVYFIFVPLILAWQSDTFKEDIKHNIKGTANLTTAQTETWRVVDVQTLPSTLSEIEIQYALPAPDGHTVAYDKFDFSNDEPQGLVCRYDFLAEREDCILKSKFLLRTIDNTSPYTSSRWSDDSTRLAFVGDSLRSNRDYDFNIIDFSDLTWTVFLEDAYTSDDQIFFEFDQPFTIEITPVWSPDSPKVAMEQITIDYSRSNPFSSEIIVLDVASQTVETVVSLGDLFADIDNPSGITLDLAWSPDSQQLAAVFWNADETFTTRQGIWSIDIVSGNAEQIVILDEIAASLSDLSGYEIPSQAIFPSQLSWSPDGQQILFVTSLPGEAVEGSEWAYIFDITTHELRALPISFDLKENPTRKMTATWSPEGNYILWSAHMPLSQQSIHSLIENEEAVTQIGIVNLTDNTTQILGGLPYLNFNRVTWGDTNTVLLNTYFLQLEGE